VQSFKGPETRSHFAQKENCQNEQITSNFTGTEHFSHFSILQRVIIKMLIKTCCPETEDILEIA
jgi:hypothetical protein